MDQSRLLRLLFQPSLSSETVTVGLALGVVGGSAWTYVSAKQLFYDYVFGAYGFKTYIWQQSASITAFRDTMLNSSVAYYVFVALAATAVGLIVYAGLQFLSLLFSWRHWSGLDSLGVNRSEIARELFRRLCVRVATMLGWAVFGACFFALLLPMVALLSQMGVDHIQEGMKFLGGLILAAAVVILALALHLQVVFLRLVLLRPRVFWSAQAVEEIEAAKDLELKAPLKD